MLYLIFSLQYIKTNQDIQQLGRKPLYIKATIANKEEIQISINLKEKLMENEHILIDLPKHHKITANIYKNNTTTPFISHENIHQNHSVILNESSVIIRLSKPMDNSKRSFLIKLSKVSTNDFNLQKRNVLGSNTGTIIGIVLGIYYRVSLVILIVVSTFACIHPNRFIRAGCMCACCDNTPNWTRIINYYYTHEDLHPAKRL